MLAIDISGISKQYKSVTALDQITFQVDQGEIFGLIGPDGAGKTSLFRILTTLILPDSGTASVMGYDVVKEFRKIRTITGYMPGRFSLYQDLTVEENLNFYATVFGTTVKENYDLIRDIYQHIEPFKTRKAGKLSGGMKQKLALSCAMINHPEVLILDEPTTGVDAVSRKEFWEMLDKIRQRNITILVSTAYMDEAGLCDRIGLIQGGKILALDRPGAILKKFDKKLYAVRTDKMYQLIKDLDNWERTDTQFLFGQDVHVTIQPCEEPDKLLGDYLKSNDHKEVNIKEILPGVEDCFLELMNSVDSRQ
ncbi:MAG: ABC transporter ATP-binding protein [Bacteroidales bacterium]|nr:ABC transporter ATP-binding protein [Bacteroidales bacterium]